MLRRFVWWIAAVLLASIGPAGAQAAEAGRDLAVATARVIDTGVERDVIWFQFGRQRRFLVPRDSTPDSKGVVAALKHARKSNGSVSASYDPASGQVDAGGRITFLVRRLTYDGRTIEGSHAPGIAPEPRSPQEAAGRDLARAMAFRDQGRSADAHDAVRRALESGSLDPRLRESAFRSRAVVTAELAHDLGLERRTEADELLVESLLALRGALALSPGDRSLVQGVGDVLVRLGAYEEGLRWFEAAAKAQPDDTYWPTMNMSIALRSVGRPEQALAALDALAARQGPQDGMAFHYHRGWTLSDLGRHEEAIAEYTAGLKSQPDYEWGLIKRACSAATLGRLRAALADQEQAVTLNEKTVETSPGRVSFAFNLARAKAVRDILRAAVASESTAAMPDLCSGYWPADGERRARSSLLPPEAAPLTDGVKPASS